jgi:hypothetical protein
VLNYIAKRIAPLASSSAQRRWIVDGTADWYLLPSELLEQAIDAPRCARLQRAQNAVPSNLFSALERLAALAGRVSLHNKTNQALIEHDPAWAAARQQARICLDLLGFDLREWEAGEGLIDSA